MKGIKLHITLDIVIMWLFIALCFICGLFCSAWFIILSIPLAIWYGVRTFLWLRIIIVKRFSKPVTMVTKGFRYAQRERVYPLSPKSKHFYSLIVFDDIRIKGNYIFLETATFKHGEEVEITFYPKAKYIESIVRH